MPNAVDKKGKKPTAKEANVCMALGAGVGVLGAASAVAGAAVCPICIVVAPGLIGYGAYCRWKAKSEAGSGSYDDQNAEGK